MTTSPSDKLPYRRVVVHDFEFSAPDDGDRPGPHTYVARELRTGTEVRLLGDELTRSRAAPFPVDDDTLYVSYMGSAEAGCFKALGWCQPRHHLDLFVEHRVATNGMRLQTKNDLVGALTLRGMDAIDAAEKKLMQQLGRCGPPYDAETWRRMSDYCASDVDSLARLLPAMLPQIDLARAVYRGRFMLAAGAIEFNGVPMDLQFLDRLGRHLKSIGEALIQRVDANFGVYDGTTFKAARWAEWLSDQHIAWPVLDSGALALDEDTFKDMARVDARIRPIHELRATLAQIRGKPLHVGRDGRNRALTSAFSAVTSRNQPSNTASIFGRPSWMRRAIRSRPGYGSAYLDWSQQEWGVAAALSGDAAMLAAYETGDAYLAFAKMNGAVAHDAAKKSPGVGLIREQYKGTGLGVLYGQGRDGVALRIQRSPAHARQLLEAHHRLFRKFWEWSDAAVSYAMLFGHINTVFGWPVFLGREPNPRSLRNFPMQANSAEMLRLAACLAIERGVNVCALVHDAFLIEERLDELSEKIAIADGAMREASMIVLDGFPLRTVVKEILYPECFIDERGVGIWRQISGLLDEVDPPGPLVCVSEGALR
ncbi:MAG: DNA polymerase [Deltaproteobacteria bacterium]